VGVASHFASQNFNRVALLSRNAERLQSDVAAVSEATRGANRSDVTVKPYPVDVSDMASLERVLRQVVQELGKPEVVVYNAAALRSGKFFELTEEDVNTDFKVATLGLYCTARVLMPDLVSLSGQPGRKPALLVTSGGLYKDAFAPFFSLSLSKASQHSLTMSLSQVYAKQGVLVSAVVVHGLVKPESEIFSPKKIAEVFWDLHQQGAGGEKEVWITDGKGWTKI